MNKQSMMRGLGVVNEDEKLLFAKVFDQSVLAQKHRSPKFTKFMDRAKCLKYEMAFVNAHDIFVRAFGGVPNAERMRLGFFPKIYDEEEVQFPISTLSISRKHKKFGQTDLSHRDYLGSILGLGLERDYIGDIIVSDDGAVCVVDDTIADYILSQLVQVSRTNVKVTKIETPILVQEKETKQKRITVSSLRLDGILSSALQISRGNSQELIKKEKVNVNWEMVTNPSFQIKDRDMISARKYGRFLVAEIGGTTKKDRIVVEVHIYI